MYYIGRSSLKIKLAVKIYPAETGYFRTDNESVPRQASARGYLTLARRTSSRSWLSIQPGLAPWVAIPQRYI
jgi:hypothetical protein